MIVTLQNWIQPEIVRLVVVGSPMVISVAHGKQMKKDVRIEALEKHFGGI